MRHYNPPGAASIEGSVEPLIGGLLVKSSSATTSYSENVVVPKDDLKQAERILHHPQKCFGN
jgi:hypothetical protein